MKELWTGSGRILLTEYFENKQKLADKKQMKRCLRNRESIALDKEIRELEINIMKFVSGLDNIHLKSLIYMSVDMNVEPDGFHFKFVEE